MAVLEKGMHMGLGVVLVAILFAVLTALSGCSYGFREDVDQIGSIRRTHTLGWKEGPREEAYRPHRQQQNYYYQSAPPPQQDCPPEAQAPSAPGNGWQPWMK